MRIHLFPLIFFIAIFIILSPSVAEPTETIAVSPFVDQILNKIHQWRNYTIKFDQPRIQFSVPILIAGVLSFLAASISSAGGIGGGGLYIPIMTILAGLDLKTASSFSAFMVTGGSIANVGCNLFVKNPNTGGKSQIDFDLALLLEPCMLLGVSVGVICNVVFPNWLVTILFAVFLAWSTTKTCKNGIYYWRLESEMENFDETTRKDEMKFQNKEPLLSIERENDSSENFPWMKLGVLLIVWFSFFAIYLLRGNKYGEGIITIKPCGVAYWFLSSLQIPLALVFTLWICLSNSHQSQQPELQQSEKLLQDIEDFRTICPDRTNKCMFPVMSLLAGALGGLFGIGGGMLISPLLLQVGIAPEVTAATCSFMVLFSSTMSAIQYLLLGMEQMETALIFAVICFVASLLGLMVVQRVITEYGRASIIVFSVGIVMALSSVLMTSYGAVDVWKDYVSGSYMGFKLPC